MTQEIKTRFWKYCKSISVVGLLSLVLAHGPCGGWVVGLIIGLFLGLTLTATIWLLDFKWYWNLFFGLLISTITLAITIATSRQFLFENNESLSNLIDCLIVLIVFIIFIELANAIGRQTAKSQKQKQ
jgi:hypothetical protein